MPTPLADRITTLPEKTLYDMLESGWSATVVRGEIARRGLKPSRPRPKKGGAPRGRGHAKRKCGVTGGYVDADTITKLGRPAQVGQAIEPWNRYATN